MNFWKKILKNYFKFSFEFFSCNSTYGDPIYLVIERIDCQVPKIRYGNIIRFEINSLCSLTQVQLLYLFFSYERNVTGEFPKEKTVISSLSHKENLSQRQ